MMRESLKESTNMADPTRLIVSEKLFSPLKRACRAGVEFLAHAALLVFIEIVMKGIEICFNFVGSADRVFQLHGIKIPQRELFDGADLALLLCITLIGIRATIKKYKETPRKPDVVATGASVWKS